MSAGERLLEGRTVDVFCRVVDNFGDAGVCWRLARTLAEDQGADVTLWIDDLQTLAAFVHAVAVESSVQTVAGLAIRRWADDSAFDRPADLVIEAFGCGLPESFIAAMAARAPRSLWLVLEYLSAEEWVTSHHCLPSPHPCWTLNRYFFFPGFVHGTGGLLREHAYSTRFASFRSGEAKRFWGRVGHEVPPSEALVVSMFAYASAPLEALLDVWARGRKPVVVALPEGMLVERVLRWFDLPAKAEQQVMQRGALQVRRLPFLEHAQYDELLWSCDLNFVRGEDSFVRAQWAERPFVWQIYPQADLVHAAKLDAFLKRYAAELPSDAVGAALDFVRCWNGLEVTLRDPELLWSRFAAALPALRNSAPGWSARLQRIGSLTDNLAQFCSAKLK